MRTSRLVFSALAGLVLGAGPLLSLPGEAKAPLRVGIDGAAGSTTTILADGRVLRVGGPDVNADGVVFDPRSGTTSLVPGRSVRGRTGHTATVLPDGSVLILGGRDGAGTPIMGAERFVPALNAFVPVDPSGLSPRMQHTATLLTDGRVAIVGGRGADGQPVLDVDWWASATGTVESTPGLLPGPLVDHQAVLAADGTVWLGPSRSGAGSDGLAVRLNPDVGTAEQVAVAPIDGDVLTIADSVPRDGDAGVPLDVRVVLRFTLPVLTLGTLSLQGPGGEVTGSSVLTEGGRLLWISPRSPLQGDSDYVVAIGGVVGANGAELPPTTLRFRTGTPDGPQRPSAPDEPGRDERSESERAFQSPWRSLPPLQAPTGETALAGQALRLNGQPLADVTIEIDEHSTRTDSTGRFLLTGLSAGHHEFIIDGSTAGTPGRTYGVFEVGVTLQQGRTTSLGYTIWMTEIDDQHAVTIPARTSGELVVRNPRIPGLELRLPSGSTVKDRHGNVVTQISITPIPIDQPPFPLPPDLDVPIYFTVQPGAAYVEVHDYSGPRGARLFYPNLTGYPVGKRMAFWHYDPEGRGWYVYGQGAVMTGGRQIVPDPGVTVYEFTGAMVADPFFGPPVGPVPTSVDVQDGDPVDLGTGLFVLRENDLFIRDVLPIGLTRTYRQNDSRSRPFGIGATHGYEMFLVGMTNPWTSAELVLPDGGRVPYVRISPGGGFTDAVFEHTSSPSRFQKSRISWNGSGWDLRLRDGTVYLFPDGENVTTPARAAMTGVRDRNGNAITLRRDGNGRLLEVVSPHGRWIRLTYDAANRITRADDHAGRYLLYTYDTIGRLATVRDTGAGVTTYTYDAAHRMETLRDARNNVFLTNEYDASGRVFRQTLGDTGVYQFAYTTDGTGRIVQTDVTDPRGFVRRVTFNAQGYRVSDTRALGQPQEQTVTWVLHPVTNLPTSMTDALNRQTTYTYDAAGNVLTETRLAGTADAVTTTYTYEPVFHQVASITDPLTHTWSIGYDTRGNLTSLTDPLTHQQTVTYDARGRVLTLTDPLDHVTRFGYAGADLATITNAAGETTVLAHDTLGRSTATTDALGRHTAATYDDLDRQTAITDALGGVTSLAYDPNGNLLSLTDARTHTTGFTYDILDRLDTRTDPLTQTETSVRDLLGNLTRHTDRKGQVTTYAYDPLNRRAFAAFGTVGTPPSATYESTVATTFDNGNRVVTLVDSQAGTIQRTYDGLDRLLSETTPQGSVTYTYDAAGRRTSLTVAGQPTVTYTYDHANRLLTIQQGATTVTYTYDDADRRTSVTLPNGILVETGYDAASRVTSLTYRLGAAVLGDLTYTYNAAGERVEVGGTFARTGLPAAVASAAYDAANRGTVFGGATLSHDLNGNLTSDGSRTYTRDARDRLVGLSGPGVTGSFAYDATGRRTRATVNGQAVGFLYDGLNPVQELDGATPTANLLTGLGIDELLSRDTGSGARSVLADALGSSVALTTPGGAVETSYTYEPFGAQTTTGAPSSNRYTFTGREADGIGLLFLRERYYSPLHQRFVSEDPLDVFANARTLYEYAGNSPLTFIDRCGLDRHRPELPRCVDLFLSCLRDWTLPGASTYMEAVGSAAVNTRAIQLHNQALQHAAARGLRYPFRSSIFRGLLSNSRWWLGAGNVMVSLGVLDIGIGYCLTQEVNAALSGQCR